MVRLSGDQAYVGPPHTYDPISTSGRLYLPSGTSEIDGTPTFVCLDSLPVTRLNNQRSPSNKKEAYRPLGDTFKFDLFPPESVRRFLSLFSKEICQRSPERKYIRSSELGVQTNIFTPPSLFTSEVS